MVYMKEMSLLQVKFNQNLERKVTWKATAMINAKYDYHERTVHWVCGTT